MRTSDKDAIANLYLEYTVGKSDPLKILYKIISDYLLGKKYPFVFGGITPDSEGDMEELTVAGMPITDYQIKNIVYAYDNDSLSVEGPEEYKNYTDKTSDDFMQTVDSKLRELLSSNLGASYHGHNFNPNALSKPSGKTPRFNPEDE